VPDAHCEILAQPDLKRKFRLAPELERPFHSSAAVTAAGMRHGTGKPAPETRYNPEIGSPSAVPQPAPHRVLGIAHAESSR
jgi:hypothetical protein